MKIIKIALAIITIPFCQLANSQTFTRKEELFKNFLSIGSNGSHVKLPANQIWKTQEDFTIEAIIRFNQPSNPNGAAIFINSVGTSGQQDWGWGFVAINNKFGFHACTPQPSQIMANQTDTVSACTWYHIAGKKQGSKIFFYLNGIKKSEMTLPPGQILRTSEGDAQIGYHRPPYQNWFDGNIDELRYWNRALTESEILENMNDTLAGNEIGLLTYYKFDNIEGSGPNLIIRNSANSTGANLNGITISSNSNNPSIKNIDNQITPPKPIIINDISELCSPGGLIKLSIDSTLNQRWTKTNWLKVENGDTINFLNSPFNNSSNLFFESDDTILVQTETSNNCKSAYGKAVIKINFTPEVKINLIGGKICINDTLLLEANIQNNIPSTFSWFIGYEGNILLSDSINSIKLLSNGISDTIWVIAKSLSANCNSNKEKIIIKPQNSPETHLNFKEKYCEGDSINLLISSENKFIYSVFKDSIYTNHYASGITNQNLFLDNATHNIKIWIRINETDSTCQFELGKKLIDVEKKTQVQFDTNFNYYYCGMNVIHKYKIKEKINNVEWNTKNSGIIIGENPNDTITILWNSNNPKLHYRTKSEVCNYEFINQELVSDTLPPVIKLVSTLKDNDDILNICYILNCPDQRTSFKWSLIRNDGEQEIELFPNSTSSFLDYNVKTAENVYQYKIIKENHCKLPKESQRLESILLTTKNENKYKKVTHFWNKQNSNGSKYFFETINQNESYIDTTLLEKTAMIREIFYYSYDFNTDDKSFRIIKKIADSTYSYSNITNIPISELKIPNLITRNSDGKNDFFKIEKPDISDPISIKIFNRWGQLILNSEDYKNDWTSSSGVYFCELKYQNKLYFSWINIIK